MELFITLITLLGFFGLLLMIRVSHDDIKRLNRNVSELKSDISNIEFKLRSETIKNNLREIDRRNEKLDRMIRGRK